jgi:CheY-like chemotaxis protein
VALTAHAMGGERERCITHGMDGYLSKPFNAHDLFATVEGWWTNPAVRSDPLAEVSATARVPEAQGEVGAGAGSPDEQPVPAAVDLSVLRIQLRDAGSEAALDGIVDTFLASVPERVVSLCSALASGSSVQVATAAHALKSSTGAIGARPLTTLLAEIEAAGWAETLADRIGLASRVQTTVEQVLSDLRDYRHQVA